MLDEVFKAAFKAGIRGFCQGTVNVLSGLDAWHLAYFLSMLLEIFWIRGWLAFLIYPGSEAERYREPGILRERYGAGDGAGGVYQCRAASDRYGQGVRHRAHYRRLPSGEMPRRCTCVGSRVPRLPRAPCLCFGWDCTWTKNAESSRNVDGSSLGVAQAPVLANRSKS